MSFKITVAPAQETVPCHDGSASGSVTIPLVFSGLSHTDTAITDLTQVEGEVHAGGLLAPALLAERVAAKILNINAILSKL